MNDNSGNIKVTMETEEAIKQFDNKEFLDKLYGFACKRCSSSHEAEAICGRHLDDREKIAAILFFHFQFISRLQLK